jgi:hypothetical protein
VVLAMGVTKAGNHGMKGRHIGIGGARILSLLLARKLGLGAGIDLARGPEDSVVYLTVGSAW